ncbi:MAG: hypothetical protein Q7S51_01390 [Gallionellaceae bacterium]|nr:hypothetical protein [Gallionellaceae bacterium]
MKGLFWILLLANLLFFAYIQWGAAWLQGNKNLPEQPPLNAGKIKLQAASAVLPTVPMATPAPAPVSQVSAAVASTCVEWGEFSGNDLSRVSAVLDSLNLGNKLAQRHIEYTSGYWAYLPPSKKRAEVDKKIAALKKYGVTDYFIVQEPGKWHNAISLGVFKTGEAAHKFVESVHAKGIKTALTGERMSKLKFTIFQLKNLDSATLQKITALQKEFVGSEVSSGACEAVTP